MYSMFATKCCSFIRKPFIIPKNYITITRYLSNMDILKQSKFVYEPDFTTDQQKMILEKLNDDNIDLRRYSLPKNRLKRIDEWRRKNGKFNSLNDVLDVEGLGVKTLDKLCKTILQGETNDELKDKPNRSRGQFLTPLLSPTQLDSISTAVGIHLYATGISWAKMERENKNLSDWNYYDFNLGSKKISPADALHLVIDVSSEIPASDVYIFEAPVAVTPTAQQSQISVTAYVQKVQLLSMLITLLSTSTKHNPDYNKFHDLKLANDIVHLEPKVFFLRQRLPARLFRTLVGNERVSSATTVHNILENNLPEKLVYTPINVNSTLKSSYNSETPITKEVLGQTLLLTMAFMDICIYQNPNSLKFVNSNSR